MGRDPGLPDSLIHIHVLLAGKQDREKHHLIMYLLGWSTVKVFKKSLSHFTPMPNA